MISSISIKDVFTAEIALVGILLIYVMIKAEKDKSNADNEPWLRLARSIALVGAALIASIGYYYAKDLPDPLIQVVAVFIFAAIPILALDAYKLHRRSTPAKPLGQQIKAKARIY